jgi:Icc-related predicted phosphoesterase
MAAKQEIVRLAAVADLHCGKGKAHLCQRLFAKVADHADILLLAGDITDFGLPEEAAEVVRELRSVVRIPVIAVLGNHDYESGKEDDVCQVLSDGGIQVLDGTSCEVRGIGFAGIKGFAGGFDRHILEPWGERSIKQMVKEAVDEALKLETALARLRTPQRVVLMHYAPIRATVEGEPAEIFPFLGCSRLEEPLGRYPVSVVFHGHAHHGQPEGRTRHGVRVHNVALALLQKTYPDRPPFHLEEMAVTPETDATPAPARTE